MRRLRTFIAVLALLPHAGAATALSSHPEAVAVANASAPQTVSAPQQTACAPQTASAPQPDTAALHRQLDKYLAQIDLLSIQAAEAETDFLISAVTDSLLRSDVATYAYNHFRASKYMGAENVAIHIYNIWFATFKAVFPSIEQLDDAELFAMFNRRSLIGAKAPELTLENERGDSLVIPAKTKGRYCVIYFYSAGCPKCLYTSIKLKEFLSKKHPKLSFYAVFTGDDDAAWQAYTMRELKVVNNCRTKVYHLKGGDSDYPLSYAVVQTPRLFLVNPDGIIIGRNLDVPALEKLLSLQ